MSDRYPIQIRWDARKKRYIARCARLPALTAYGSSRYEADKNMREAMAEHLLGECGDQPR